MYKESDVVETNFEINNKVSQFAASLWFEV